jgi:hypothetical protein
MNCTRSLTINAFVTTKQSAAQQLLKTFAHNGATVTTHLAQPALLGLYNHHHHHGRAFSTTTPTSKVNGKKEESFPQSTTPSIRLTPPAWPHPGFTHPTMEAVAISHRPPRDIPDRIALLTVKLLRFGLDFITGYSPTRIPTARQFMIRNIFLESVAGVPGMVAGMLRHMHSLRRLKRDGGWMETLLEESYNERMHLLTFLKMAEPGWFMRLAVLATQGVFFNAFLAAYLVAPRVCHRFVGYLEEEAGTSFFPGVRHFFSASASPVRPSFSLVIDRLTPDANSENLHRPNHPPQPGALTGMGVPPRPGHRSAILEHARGSPIDARFTPVYPRGRE